MSDRDRRLLDEAHLTIADAAKLFARSRQALYTGLSGPKDYFSPQDVVAILNDARRRDLSHLDELRGFIDQAYDDGKDKLPDRIGHDQLKCVLERAERIVLCTNGNQDHFLKSAAFAKVLRASLEQMREKLLFIVPGDWVLGYLKQNTDLPALDPKQVKSLKEVANYPPFALTQDSFGRHRAFMFGRMGVEETFAHEANRMWVLLNG